MGADVLIVEDHPVVVEGLVNILGGHPGVANVYTAYDGAGCMQAMRNLNPQLVLLDINLPDAGGIGLCSSILSQWPGVKVIAVSSCAERSVIRGMIEAGASGYLLKNSPGDEIAAAVTEVLGGGTFFDDGVTQILATPVSAGGRPLLTRREQEVLKLIADGLTNGEIAEKTYVSTLTVDTHRKNLLVKLGARNSAALVRIALEKGLL